MAGDFVMREVGLLGMLPKRAQCLTSARGDEYAEAPMINRN